MDMVDDFRHASDAADLETYRRELLNAVSVRAPKVSSVQDRDFAFVCEVGTRLADAEEFQDFIPSHGAGVGYRQRKLRVDAYEIDEADDSIRLLVADFDGGDQLETIGRTRVDSVLAQLKAFVEDSITGKIRNSSLAESEQTAELARIIEQRHRRSVTGARGVSRYRFYLITDAVLSDRVKDLPADEIDGVPIERHVWDVGRLRAVSSSLLGTEEFDIDFTQYVAAGIPCLRASEGTDYEGYLCVIQGDVLADLYDRYGSRLLEGNVRSFLSTTGKVNKGIQATVRAQPDRFFVFNNGISATATAAVVVQTDAGSRLISATYLQIVNGGQTTASLHVARRKDDADLSAIQVPMKLSVVRAENSEMLDEMIQKIARYSNSQNKVSDADFFSNHPFHRALERRSRTLPAPRSAGMTFNTYWFYERARGQYLNAQAKMTIKQKKEFLRDHPRSQLLSKTDLAKFENSWRKLPHIVSRGAQKNFLNFADYVGKNYGTDGAQFDNDHYFKEAVSRAVLFRFVENMVSEAKKSWYRGDYRAQIVTYTIAKLASTLHEKAPGFTLNNAKIWTNQGISLALAAQLEQIAMAVSEKITSPPVAAMNVGEWCKTEACWSEVVAMDIALSEQTVGELVSTQDTQQVQLEAFARASEDAVINAVVMVVSLAKDGCWSRMLEWSRQYSPLFGKEADLVRLAARGSWVPSDRQAATLVNLLKRFEQEGFSRKPKQI